MDKDVIGKALANIRAKSNNGMPTETYRVTINFHPDRYTSKGQPLLLSIAKDGELKSQFETKTSNGGLTAFEGGDRWLWEQKVFDGAYDLAPMRHRPKYGAVNFRHYSEGAAPRFGSAFFTLKPHVLKRTTYCYPDSFFEPDDFAVTETLTTLIDKARLSSTDRLDDYIEAHIHGTLSLKDDVECVVLDPIFRATVIEQYALELGVPIQWHNGYELSIETMRQYLDYRGMPFVELAQELAQDGIINAQLLGLAVTSKRYDEQDIKKIWHYLARFGYRV
ncbi:hypothetical protein VTH8203_03351 [Vibrio thalassae]|uniref:DUF3626 domain-containing protein n=1 Tax=Vibrio thalassae TaxID=1243014 RepID=A0A240EN72_9VIBR|nr:DUF3626 domain-containing protein [Vibrio thalassae]SNX49703.1 hypothetical protein VTH8203_03351 [Vibrio thalassae]